MTEPEQNSDDNVLNDDDFDSSFVSEHNSNIVISPEEIWDYLPEEVLEDSEIPPLWDIPQLENPHSEENKSNSSVKNTINLFENLTPRGSLEDLSEGASNKQPLRRTRQNTNIKKEEIPSLEDVDHTLRFGPRKSKMADAKDKTKLDRLQGIYDAYKVKLDEKFNAIKTDFDKERDDANIELLEGHLAHLGSQRTHWTKKTQKVGDALDGMEGVAHTAAFATLEEKHIEIDAAILNWIEKIKKALKKYEKDSDISNKQRLDCPSFEGDCLRYKTFKTHFTNFCKGFGESDKKAHLISALKGKALEQVQDLIDRDRDYKALIEQLDAAYGNEKRIIEATVLAYFDFIPPECSNPSVNNYWTKMRNRASNIEDLNITLGNFLTQLAVNYLPGPYKADLMRQLPPNTNKYTFAELTPKLEDVYLYREERQKNNLSCKIGTTELTAAAGITKINTNESKPNTQTDHTKGQNFRGRGRGRGRGGFRGGQRGRGGGQPHRDMYCYICEGTNHIAFWCDSYMHGPKMRERLKQLNRCDACLVLKHQHNDTCQSFGKPCEKCGDASHHKITCNFTQSNQLFHPGSWIIAEKNQSQKPNSTS